MKKESKNEIERIFITGATGTLGRALVRECQAQGILPVLLLRNPAQAALFSGEFEYVIGQLPQFGNRSEDILTLSSCDAVIHAAASIAGTNRDRMLATNLQGTQAMLNAAIEAEVPRFVFISSIAAYGTPNGQSTITEDTPLAKSFEANTYMETKARAEAMIWKAATEGKISVSVARPGAIYSPWDRWLIRNLYAMLKLRLPLPERTYSPFPAISARSLAMQLIEQARSPKAHNQAFNAIDPIERPFAVLAQEAAETWQLAQPKFIVPKQVLNGLARLTTKVASRYEPFLTPYSVLVITNSPRFSTSKRRTLLNLQLPPQAQEWRRTCQEWLEANH